MNSSDETNCIEKGNFIFTDIMDMAAHTDLQSKDREFVI